MIDDTVGIRVVEHAMRRNPKRGVEMGKDCLPGVSRTMATIRWFWGRETLGVFRPLSVYRGWIVRRARNGHGARPYLCGRGCLLALRRAHYYYALFVSSHFSVACAVTGAGASFCEVT